MTDRRSLTEPIRSPILRQDGVEEKRLTPVVRDTRRAGSRRTAADAFFPLVMKRLFVAIMLTAVLPMAVGGDEVVAPNQAAIPNDAAIIAAYRSASDGYSSDEIILHDGRRHAWLTALDPDWMSYGEPWQSGTLLRLIGLRKAGKLPAMSRFRGAAVDPSIVPIAEIAARRVMDEHDVSTDELLCNDWLHDELQRYADEIVPGVDGYAIRKSVLRLRKSRRLRPELTLRVTDWHRSIATYSYADLDAAIDDGETITRGAGVYLFRDATGYLYIGEASDLRERLKQHLRRSDRLSLRQHLETIGNGDLTIELHTFDKDSPANRLDVRRAYESELIRSREPRLNVRP